MGHNAAGIIIRQERQEEFPQIYDLVKIAFQMAVAMGYTSVLLVGDPAYYHKFGFKSAIDFGIKHMHEIPDKNVMACELVPGALKNVTGTTDCF